MLQVATRTVGSEDDDDDDDHSGVRASRVAAKLSPQRAPGHLHDESARELATTRRVSTISQHDKFARARARTSHLLVTLSCLVCGKSGNGAA